MALFETPRMTGRPIAERDFAHLYRLWTDPVTMQYIRAPYTEEAAAYERLVFMLEYSKNCPGFGSFALEMKDSGAFAGFCVARHVDYDPTSQEYEIGYILAPESRGKGLASELVPPLSRYCFEQSAADSLIAFTHPDNAVSQKVLLKNGFHFVEKRETSYGVSAVFCLQRNPA